MQATRVGGLAAAFFMLAAAAWAHGEYDWIRERGLKNPVTGRLCCGLDDCAPLPSEQVRRAGPNWLIEVAGRVHLYPVAQQLPSADGRYWLCVKPSGEPRCFFVPGLGA